MSSKTALARARYIPCLRGMARICTACATPAEDEVATTIDESEDSEEAVEAGVDAADDAADEKDDADDAGFAARLVALVTLALYAAAEAEIEGVAETDANDGVAAASFNACGDGLTGEAVAVREC